ncbi:MAG: hypothetical protein ACE5JI_21300 [Acidobacteriota bacterium]
MTLRWRRWLGTGISYGIPVTAGMLALAVPPDLTPGCILVGGAAVLGRAQVERWLWGRLAPYGRCGACGHALPLVARWKCSCGHLPPVPDHVFRKCSLCRKGFRWVTCPNCEGSVLI